MIRPKYVHLINEQFFDQHNDAKDTAYDLSTTSLSSTIKPASSSDDSNQHLNRLIQHEDTLKLQNSIDERLNGMAVGTPRKIQKHSLLNHSFSASSNLVTVMMDENKGANDIEDHSFYMPMRREENAPEYDEGKNYLKKLPKN